MTSSKQKLTDLLFQNDFAEVAQELQQKKLLEAKKKQQEAQKEIDHKRELERLAAMPKISEEDVQKADQAGYERGLNEGRLQAEQALREEFANNLSQLEAQFQNIEPLVQQHLANVEQSSLNFLTTTLKSIIQHSSEHYSEDVLKFTINEALSKADKEKELTIALAPASRFYVEDIKSDLFKDLKVKLVEDTNLEQGDCVITWDEQGVSAKTSKVVQELEKIISAAAQNIKPEDIELNFIQEAQKAEVESLEQPETVEAIAEETDVTVEMPEQPVNETTNTAETEAVEAQTETTAEPQTATETSSEDVTTDIKNAENENS